MKGTFTFIITSILVIVSTQSVYANHYGFCQKKEAISPVSCASELPLVYSDPFNIFNKEYWSTENGRVRTMKGSGWVQMKYDTITSMDYIDQNLTDFRILLRFHEWQKQSPVFTIHFTNGEELEFSYQKITIQQRKRQITKKQFSITAWPEIADKPVPLHFSGRWNTLLVDYNNATGVVSLDTNNDCDFDHVLVWKPGLQFSHVTGSNQKWDLFELYAAMKQVTDDSTGIPEYQLEWSGVGDGARGIAVDSSNNVYVSSPSDNSVKKFDENGNLLAEWFDFVDPQGLSISSDNHVYIADAGSSSIKKYNTNGVLISELPRYGGGYESLSSVQDVAVDDQGVVYVSSFNIWFDGGIVFGSKIFKFTSEWVFIGEVVPGINSIITGLDIDSQGNIYLTTTDGIRKYDSYGNFLMNIGTVSGGNGAGEFSRGSHDVHISDTGLLYATDGNENNRIQVFNLNGEYQYEWGTTGSENGEFMEPTRISVTSRGVFILDTGNSRVQKFQ
jgi:hypothetical protein